MKPEDETQAVAPPFEQGVGRLDPKRANEPAPTQNQSQRHYPEEWGPSTARHLTCVCGNPDPGHADKTPNV